MLNTIFTILETWLAEEHNLVELFLTGYVLLQFMIFIYTVVTPRLRVSDIIGNILIVPIFILLFMYLFLCFQITWTNFFFGSKKAATLGAVMLIGLVVVPVIVIRIDKLVWNKKQKKLLDEMRNHKTTQEQVNEEALEICKKVIANLQQDKGVLIKQKHEQQKEILALRERCEILEREIKQNRNTTFG